ncbi:MAG: hypothetical protein WC552_04650 [Candidatus Omnitrophota bacterium]
MERQHDLSEAGGPGEEKEKVNRSNRQLSGVDDWALEGIEEEFEKEEELRERKLEGRRREKKRDW